MVLLGTIQRVEFIAFGGSLGQVKCQVRQVLLRGVQDVFFGRVQNAFGEGVQDVLGGGMQDIFGGGVEDVVGGGVKDLVDGGGGGFEIETAVVGVLLAGFALELGVERQGLFVGINVNVVVDVDGGLLG